MAKISRQTIEIIKIVIFLSITGFLLTAYVIYPLNKIKTISARINVDNFDQDSLATNSGSLFSDGEIRIDTFSVESGEQITIQALYINRSNMDDSARGTVLFLHKDESDRSQFTEQARILSSSGYQIVVYDQRASGFTNGKYRGDGQQEATDLIEVLRYLDIRDKLFSPVTVVGFELGADAAILSADQGRFEKLVLINPHLTSQRMQDILKEKNELFWFPYYRTTMWYWYQMRSGYETPYRKLEDIKAVKLPTLMFMNEKYKDDDELIRYVELADEIQFTLRTLPVDESLNWDEIYQFIEKE